MNYQVTAVERGSYGPDIYLLFLHPPYTEPGHPVPFNATIVHAASLLNSDVPQPDGGRIYRCLVEAPGRQAGDVPLATLTWELDGGRLWPEVGDWEAVTAALSTLARNRGCDAMPVGLPDVAASLLANGPYTEINLHHADGTTTVMGPADRAAELATLTSYVQQYAADGPFWPGKVLVRPSKHPAQMPYKPQRSGSS